jgi:competence protein ComEA
MKRVFSFAWGIVPAALFLSAVAAPCQDLPEGPGRELTMKMCKGCHEVARSVSLRQDRDGWNRTMNKMIAFGMKGSQEEIATVLDYLVKHFPADEVPRLNVNTATAIELESGLSLKRSQAKALIAHREKHGEFKSIEDLKKVPNLDAGHIEARKDRIVF